MLYSLSFLSIYVTVFFTFCLLFLHFVIRYSVAACSGGVCNLLINESGDMRSENVVRDIARPRRQRRWSLIAGAGGACPRHRDRPFRDDRL